MVLDDVAAGLGRNTGQLGLLLAPPDEHSLSGAGHGHDVAVLDGAGVPAQGLPPTEAVEPDDGAPAGEGLDRRKAEALASGERQEHLRAAQGGGVGRLVHAVDGHDLPTRQRPAQLEEGEHVDRLLLPLAGDVGQHPGVGGLGPVEVGVDGGTDHRHRQVTEGVPVELGVVGRGDHRRDHVGVRVEGGRVAAETPRVKVL